MQNFEIIQVSSIVESPYISSIVGLLESAFPVCERRDTQDFVEYIAVNPYVECYAIVQSDSFVGFIYLWRFTTFVYWEFIAIDDQYRGKGVFSSIFIQVREREELPFVCEAERADTNIAKRRIALYQRLGWRILPKEDYVQPPFRKEDAPTPMYLLGHEKDMPLPPLEDVLSTLYKHVYTII